MSRAQTVAKLVVLIAMVDACAGAKRDSQTEPPASPSSERSARGGATAAADCSRICTISHDGDYVVVDGNTGRVTDGSTRFPTATTVRVTLGAKNPFKYRYRTEITSQATSTDLISQFFDIAKIAPLTKKTLSDGGPKTFSTDTNDECGPYNKSLDALQNLAAKAEDGLKNLNGLNDRVVAFLNDTDVEAIDCQRVCERSRGIVSETDASTGALNALVEGVARQPPIPGICTNDQAKFLDLTRKSGAATQALTDAKPMLEQENRIAVIVSDASSFVESRYPQVLPEATSITVNVFRTDLRAKSPVEKNVTSVTLSVGASRFSLTAGVGITTVLTRHVVRQASSAIDSAGAPIVGTVFGYDTNSRFHPGVLVLLNADLYRCKNFSIAPSAGLLITENVTNAPPLRDWVLGLSTGFLDSSFYVTTGIHVAQVEFLSGGFHIGDPVPSGLQDPLPIERNWRVGFLFGLSYRLK
jgi:hypothetical protein